MKLTKDQLIKEVEDLRRKIAELTGGTFERPQAAEAAPVTPAALHWLIQQLPVGVQVFDTNGLCVDVNEAHLRIFGTARREQLIGHYSLLNDPQAERIGTQAAGREALAGRTVHLPEVHFDFSQADPRFARTRGECILAVTFFPVRNAGGEIIQIVVLNEDISERIRAEKTLHHRVQFEKLIGKISTQFINLSLDNINEGISQALQLLGEFTEADRSYIFLFPENGTRTADTYGWCSPGVTPQLEPLKALPHGAFPWWLEKLNRFDIVYVRRVADLPPEAQAETEILLAQGVQSHVLVPLVCSGALIGVLGLEWVRLEKQWNEDDAIPFKIVSEAFVNAFERTWAEEALRSSEERFRQVITSISDHIYVTEVTEDGRHLNLYLSPHVDAMTGYPHEKFDDWRFWPSKVIHPEDRGAAAEQATLLAEGQDSEAEYRLVRADGRVIWVRDRATVKMEGTSRVVYGLVSDITGRKLVDLEREWLTNELRDINQTLDERVRSRTAELQAILDSAGEGIVVTDLNGVIRYINPALENLTGYSEAEVLEQTPRLWSSHRYGQAFYAQMWQTILSGQTWRGELINKHKNGTLFHSLLTIAPILGPDDHPISFVGLQSDITPFKEMDRMKNEFISTAAHELRTPLTSIQGFSEILLSRKLTEERKTRFLSFINQQAEALTAIIEDLLDVSRLEAKQGFKVADELVDLKEIVEQVVFGFQENYPRHCYKIIGPESWPSIKGDPAKLAQLFKNLFSNATKYSPEGGDVTFEVALESRYNLVHLTLTDHGVGMTSEQLAKIFDRFYRADASNTAIGGTGLGMTISRLIIERHGGKIWVESEYGAGTTVHVLLPLPNRPTYILIIEDDLMLQEVQQRSLELQGFTVLTAGEGKTGLKLARTCLPNLILLDLALPSMTGFTVLGKLAESDLIPSIPVIITSAMDRPEEIEKAIAKGVIDYLVKPYSMSDLTVRVNRALVESRQDFSV